MRMFLMALGFVALAGLAGIGFMYSMPNSSPEHTADAAPALEGDGQLKLIITNIRNDKGIIYGAIFDDKDIFESADYEQAALQFEVKPEAIGVEQSFNLPEGDYAVFVFHDENKNMDLDSKGMIPTEGYAYSQNAGRNDLPSFEDAKFKLADSSSVEKIKMIYYQ
ncbi:DUF2141 domain-containing protein [Endozoicomonas arenosclerae]|uniref:DUF2141 domain-containing protein n=1 Tax=Endozoicomonas arenosclerae TaxID=1633495 RepID=UPI0007803C29|nr:DUF2141 domain-containing protein [Endozoicomonas arenosclerae]